MKLALTKTFVGLACVLALASCAQTANVAVEQPKAQVTTLNPIELQAQHLVDATSWVQNSGEYRALAYQAFNYAKISFDKAKVPAGKLKAVVSDLDETLIDNSAYQGSLVHYGKEFESATWGEWEKVGNPTAIPGAVEFAKYVNAHGGKMYYVSNRQHANLEGTIRALQALGFPGVSAETVLLKNGSSNKEIRFNEIQKVNPIVMYVGDNLNDFPGGYSLKNKADRQAWADKNATQFGVTYIALPNPMYGNWMSALDPNFYNKSKAEQNEVRINSIQKWDQFPGVGK